jgi:hypothetical protein
MEEILASIRSIIADDRPGDSAKRHEGPSGVERSRPQIVYSRVLPAPSRVVADVRSVGSRTEGLPERPSAPDTPSSARDETETEALARGRPDIDGESIPEPAAAPNEEPTQESPQVYIHIYDSTPLSVPEFREVEPAGRLDSLATYFINLDIKQHPIWKSICEIYPGAEIFCLFVPETAIHEDVDGRFSANGQLLITVPARRRNGLADIAHITIELDFAGEARDGIEVESVGLRGEPPVMSRPR